MPRDARLPPATRTSVVYVTCPPRLKAGAANLTAAYGGTECVTCLSSNLANGVLSYRMSHHPIDGRQRNTIFSDALPSNVTTEARWVAGAALRWHTPHPHSASLRVSPRYRGARAHYEKAKSLPFAPRSGEKVSEGRLRGNSRRTRTGRVEAMRSLPSGSISFITAH